MYSLTDPVNRPLNDQYETDIRYVFQFCNWTLRLLGIYPFIYSQVNKLERLVSVMVILVCFFILQFVIVPFGYYVVFYEKRMSTKIKFVAPLAFCLLSLFKYGYLGVKGSALGRCIEHVKHDWKILHDEDHRAIMMRQVTMSRNLTKMCAIFVYTGGMSYHTIMPLLTKKRINENYTVRSLTYPGYEAFFDVQKDPTYEIIFCMHCMYVMVSGSIMMLAYSLTTIFTTHACGQIKIQTLRLENLSKDGDETENEFDVRLTVAVKRHVEILRFTKDIENTFRVLFLVEIMVTTLLMCLLEYYCMMEWKRNETVATFTYVTLLSSFTLNILIFCYVGELLIKQGSEITNAAYETHWYNLPGRKARDIVLVLAASRYPPKLTAGKVIVLSLSTFGEVLKASVVYLNMLRAVSES